MSEQQTNVATASGDAAPNPIQAAEEHYASIRSDAAKAVEAAIKEAEAKEPAQKASAEDPEAPDTPTSAAPSEDEGGKPAESAPTEGKRGIADILGAREKAAKPKTDVQKALEEARKLSEETKATQAELAREREALRAERAKVEKLKDLKNAPDALKELGWDPDEFVTAAANANTPMGRLEAIVRQQAEVISQLKSKADGWEKDAEEQKATAKKQQEEQAVRATEEAFTKLALDAEKFPTLAQLYGGDDEDREILIMKAHGVARRYRAATGGEEATFEDIASYLEDRAQEKLGGAKKEKASDKNGKAQPGGRPAGKRTVNGSDASVRTSAPETSKATDDLDELRRRAKAAEIRAIRESGGA